jgi:serine/threonine protein kinase
VELPVVTLPRGLAGRFQLLSRFGGGGLGELFRVRAKATQAELALRLTIFKSAPEIVTSLTGVVTLHGRLFASGSSLVRVVEAGGDTESDTSWYAMEIASGESILERVRRTGRMTPASATRLLVQLAAQIAALHDERVLHQDLSARNVFVDGDSVKLLELGVAASIARAIGERPGAFTTPRAKAPEQLVADAVPATDLYALGCLLYYVLTGRKAIADGAPNLRLATAGGLRPPPLDSIVPELRPVLTRLLAMRPEDRYVSAYELSEALIKTGLAA